MKNTMSVKTANVAVKTAKNTGDTYLIKGFNPPPHIWVVYTFQTDEKCTYIKMYTVQCAMCIHP